MSNRKIRDIENSLLYDKKPSEYFDKLFKTRELDRKPLDTLKRLRDVNQSKKYHPEGSVWNHTIIGNMQIIKKHLCGQRFCMI